MTAKDLIRIGHQLYGSHGWITAMASALQVDQSTIRRWIYANRVPGPAAVALKLLEEKSLEEK